MRQCERETHRDGDRGGRRLGVPDEQTTQTMPLTQRVSRARANGAGPAIHAQQLLGQFLVQLDAVTLAPRPGPVGLLSALVQCRLHLLRVVEVVEVFGRSRFEAEKLLG